MFQLTDEQGLIVKNDPDPEGVMIVTAFAGTGKTFTLERYAEARPRDRILYAAFNKGIQLEAERKMPTNVMSRTTHSLAYRAIGSKYRDAKKLDSNVPVWRVAQYLGCNIIVAKFVFDVVKGFLASADDQVYYHHIPRNVIEYFEKEDKPMPPLVDMARGVWESMSGFGPNSLSMVHDGYLKLYQLSGPVLDFDYIMLDEAQDTTPCVWDIMKNQKGRKVVVGDPHQAIYCQPIGTFVDVPTGSTRNVQIKRIPIEQLKPGMRVVTYNNSTLYKNGREVVDVSQFQYNGRLVNITTECGKTSQYTTQHHCIVRVGDGLRGKHLVYLMRKGKKYRIGRVPFFYESQGGVFGLALRSTQEKADAAWILSVHDTVADASLWENVLQSKFSIPGVRFQPSTDNDVLDVREFWKIHGDNREDAEECLAEHGRLIDFPLWRRGNNGGELIGVRRPFVTAAANLIDGMKVLVSGSYDRDPKKRKCIVTTEKKWTPITVKSEYWSGPIVSIEVADHHNYFGNGILTHNSWRGAIDAMNLVKDAETFYLTQSFRFGPKVAELASTLLRRFKKEEKPLRGLESLDTEVDISPADGKRTVLARGNSLIFRSCAFEVESTKKTLGFVGGDHSNYRFQTYVDAFNLYKGEKDWIRDPVIKSFDTFEEFKEYSENVQSMEYQGACTVVEDYKGRIPHIMKQVKGRDIGAKYADLSYATGHKSKGLEFPVVQLANDFEAAIDFHIEVTGYVPDDELNLLYVAITRGTEKLFIPSTVKTWIEKGSTERRKVDKEEAKKRYQELRKGKREVGMKMSKGDLISHIMSSGGGEMAKDVTPDRVRRFWD